MTSPESEDPRPSRFVHLRFVLKRLVQYEVAILALVALFCLIAGVRGAQAISTVLLLVGILVVSIGPFSLMGGWGQTRNWSYMYVQSMSGERTDKRASRDKVDMDQSMGVLAPSCLLGTITLLISVVFALIFGG